MVAPRLARRAFRRENGFFSLFVGFALALQIKLSGGKPSSAPVLHHSECRFQICKNRDSRVMRIIAATAWLHSLHCIELGPTTTESILDDCRNAARRAEPPDARRWAQILTRYREPNHARSIVEIAITLGPLVALWVLAWAGYYLGFWWLSLLIAVPAAGFLVRLFMIQHDCGHGAFFSHRMANDWWAGSSAC